MVEHNHEIHGMRGNEYVDFHTPGANIVLVLFSFFSPEAKAGIVFFFLKHAGELRIIVLRRRIKWVDNPYKQHSTRAMFKTNPH